jgi:hypothetical protein
VAKCVGWLEEIEKTIPSIVVSVRSPDGKEPTEFRSFFDGKAVAQAIDGRAIETEPGARTVRVEGYGQTIEERIVAKVGEQNRLVQLQMAEVATPQPTRAATPAPAPPPPRDSSPESSRGAPGTLYLGIGALALGAVGLGFGIGTGAAALSKSSELEVACENKSCLRGTDGEIQLGDAQTVADVSTVTFIVGGVLSAVGVVLVVVSVGDDDPPASRAWVAPTLGVGHAGVRGAF